MPDTHGKKLKIWICKLLLPFSMLFWCKYFLFVPNWFWNTFSFQFMPTAKDEALGSVNTIKKVSYTFITFNHLFFNVKFKTKHLLMTSFWTKKSIFIVFSCSICHFASESNPIKNDILIKETLFLNNSWRCSTTN